MLTYMVAVLDKAGYRRIQWEATDPSWDNQSTTHQHNEGLREWRKLWRKQGRKLDIIDFAWKALIFGLNKYHLHFNFCHSVHYVIYQLTEQCFCSWGWGILYCLTPQRPNIPQLIHARSMKVSLELVATIVKIFKARYLESKMWTYIKQTNSNETFNGTFSINIV